VQDGVGWFGDFTPKVTVPTTSQNITLVDAAGSLIRVYPNPWRSDRPGTPDHITFTNLAPNSTVKIFTIAGHHVVTLPPVAGGSTPWNLKNQNGDAVASGLYLYLITDPQGHKTRGKVAVIR